MNISLERVNQAINEFKNGKLIILTDDESRENEGDLIIPAECITDQTMNLMIKHGSGIVCVASDQDLLQRLDLPLMVPEQNNTSASGTPFTISIDAKYGITTGVSAHDRVKTVLAMIADDAKPEDLAKPGHMFPLKAKPHGVFQREGHTEGSVDLAKIAGFKPAAVLCELMNNDGTMMRGAELLQFAKVHQLFILTIQDIIQYRLYHEDLIAEEAHSHLSTHDYGDLNITIYRERFSDKEHLLLMNKNTNTNEATLVRIHSSCATGDLFHSKRCDCHDQLHYSLQQIHKQGGILIYLDQEGRGIGLFNKIKTYALQDKGLDTVDANLKLGFKADQRNYAIAAHILKRQKINHVKLFTNNLNKINELKEYGIQHVAREPLPNFEHSDNQHYLATKILKLNHIINHKDAI